MMFRLDTDVTRALVREVTNRIESELGVRPTTFRAGRWGWGANVADALWKEGYRVDSSVTPLLDWSSSGGPDYS
ncbi:MAG: WalW protein, partial [Gemmatimonadetes bacterium]|nr:WalW protein [Gemmatimonadota bacterium]